VRYCWIVPLPTQPLAGRTAVDHAVRLASGCHCCTTQHSSQLAVADNSKMLYSAGSVLCTGTAVCCCPGNPLQGSQAAVGHGWHQAVSTAGTAMQARQVPPGPALHSRCAACFELGSRICLHPCLLQQEPKQLEQHVDLAPIGMTDAAQ
jgi:hypothetical protein